jgi:DNA-binding transcriptional LysR family regulator
VVGFMPGLIVTDAVRTMRDRHPGLTVDLVRTGWNDQTDVVHDGRVDVSYLRLPVDRRGLTLRPLLTEPRVAMLPAGHRLAGKETVEIAELADERLLQDPAAVPEWREVATTPPDDNPPAYAVEEKLEHVASGRGVVVLPLSTARFYTRPDVVWARITDIAANRVALAWEATRRDPLIAEFAALAEEFPAA